jgi:hypothetical protein
MERTRSVGAARRGADGGGSVDPGLRALAGAATGSGCGTGISKSAVSERFVYGTERKLAELMSRELRELNLVALMIDGVHFAEHVVLPGGGRR